jgi:hypothetical protein
MSWFRKKPAAPLPPQVTAEEAMAQMFRWVRPIYDPIWESLPVEYLLACLPNLSPWRDFLPLQPNVLEAGLALLDDKVSVLKHLFVHNTPKDDVRFEELGGKTVGEMALLHLPKLEEAIDYGLAWITINRGPVARQPINGEGLNRGAVLYQRHMELLAAASERLPTRLPASSITSEPTAT